MHMYMNHVILEHTYWEAHLYLHVMQVWFTRQLLLHCLTAFDTREICLKYMLRADMYNNVYWKATDTYICVLKHICNWKRHGTKKKKKKKNTICIIITMPRASVRVHVCTCVVYTHRSILGGASLLQSLLYDLFYYRSVSVEPFSSLPSPSFFTDCHSFVYINADSN